MLGAESGLHPAKPEFGPQVLLHLRRWLGTINGDDQFLLAKQFQNRLGFGVVVMET
jgi:hypothetical protein